MRLTGKTVGCSLVDLDLEMPDAFGRQQIVLMFGQQAKNLLSGKWPDRTEIGDLVVTQMSGLCIHLKSQFTMALSLDVLPKQLGLKCLDLLSEFDVFVLAEHEHGMEGEDDIFAGA